MFRMPVPINKIRNAFYMFITLQEINYEFVCYKCGTEPTVLIGDGNWGNTCKVSGDIYV